jgi:hypothetical protein
VNTAIAAAPGGVPAFERTIRALAAGLGRTGRTAPLSGRAGERALRALPSSPSGVAPISRGSSDERAIALEAGV